MTPKGFSLKIFLPSGDPDGLRIIEKSNWNGRGVFCPRASLSEMRGDESLTRPGVYILIGSSDEGDSQKIYVGEGDPAGDRLKDHLAKKDFWTHAVVFTSKDASINKAYVQFLEAKLISLAEEAGHCEMENKNVPALPALSAADLSEAEGFLTEMLLCLPTLGIPFFQIPLNKEQNHTLLTLRSKGLIATGYEVNQGFWLMRESQAVVQEVPTCPPYITGLRRALLAKGVLRPLDQALVFQENYLFNSPSAAAAVITGAATNGRIAWRDAATGRTLKELQNVIVEDDANPVI